MAKGTMAKGTMAKDYRRLWKGVTSTSDEGKAVRTLAEILLDKEGRTFISNLKRKDAQLCMEIFDHGLAEHNLETTDRQAFFIALRRLATIHGRLPGSMVITEEIEVSDEILASGGFADVRIGTYVGHLVAVKTMRVTKKDNLPKIRKQFCREVVLWNTLIHPNVLKFAGVRGDMDKGEFITVSEWMVHGNIMEYIEKNSVNRLELLHGAAQGLEYLHGASLTHGDLKGANILMSNDNPPRACLADFGFMTMVLSPGQPMSCSVQLEGGTIAFMSPELLLPSMFEVEDPAPAPRADIYAFGFVIYQVLTGELPFRGVRVTEIPFKLFQGVRPPKPENASAIGFSDSLWSFVQRCWDGKMKLRPEVAEIVSQLERAAADWDGVMPPCAQVECVVSAYPEPVSDSTTDCRIYVGSSSSVVPESPTESRIISMLSDPPSTSSTQHTEPSLAEALEDVIKRFGEQGPAFGTRDAVVENDRNAQNIRQTNDNQVEVPNILAPPFQRRPPHNTPSQSDPSAVHHPNNRRSQALYPGIWPQVTYPPEPHRSQPESRASTPPPNEEPPGDIPVVYPHLEQRYEPPPSQLPKKRRGFRYFGRRLLSFVGLGKEPPSS